MQPYFLPYLGYWQLLAAVDRFVVYDNIQYTKKGWINRNRFWRAGGHAYFTIPVKYASDFLVVAEREVAPDFDRVRMLAQLSGSYRKAPYFASVYPLLERIVMADQASLFDFIHHSLVATAGYLGIRTPIVISSSVAIDHTLRSEAKVLALCQALGADRYVNPIGGRDLYSRATFQPQTALAPFRRRPRRRHL